MQVNKARDAVLKKYFMITRFAHAHGLSFEITSATLNGRRRDRNVLAALEKEGIPLTWIPGYKEKVSA